MQMGGARAKDKACKKKLAEIETKSGSRSFRTGLILSSSIKWPESM